jgi:hypothetical protein
LKLRTREKYGSRAKPTIRLDHQKKHPIGTKEIQWDPPVWSKGYVLIYTKEIQRHLEGVKKREQSGERRHISF